MGQEQEVLRFGCQHWRNVSHLPPPKTFPVSWHVACGQLFQSSGLHSVCAFAASFSPRKYLGYFGGGGVTVWLHKPLHGFREVGVSGGDWESQDAPMGAGAYVYRERVERGATPGREEDVLLWECEGFGGLREFLGLNPCAVGGLNLAERLVLRLRR